MAIILTSITPNASTTAGRKLARFAGSGFKLPPPPSTFGVTPKPKPTMRVFFGAVEAIDVRVLSTTLMDVVVPSNDPGAKDVRVVAVDQAGAQLESVTFPGAFTYSRTVLERKPSEETTLQRVCRAVLQELKRQVIENVQLTVSTEFDDTPDAANVAMLATVPGLVLAGPALKTNRFYSLNAPRVVNGKRLRGPRTVDAEFTLIGVDDNSQRVLALMHEVETFFHRNTKLRLLRNAGVQDGDYVEFEMDITDDGDVKWTSTPSNSNLRAFSGSFLVRGIDLDEDDMVEATVPQVVDVVPLGAAPTEVSPLILLGQPGVTTAPPVPSGPANEVGTDGPIVQIYPSEDDE